MDSSNEMSALWQTLSPRAREQLKAFAEFLQQQEARRARGKAWSFSFLENFREASIAASADAAGMETKISEAVCDGAPRLALWEHPPVKGAASVTYLVPIPTGLRKLALIFSIGIRDGAELPRDRFVAFRVMVNGWKLWSTLKNTREWEAHEIEMPQLSGDAARVEFVTDGMGDNRWNWAVWGEPRLEGEI